MVCTWWRPGGPGAALHTRLASRDILNQSAHSPSTNRGHTQAHHAASGFEICDVKPLRKQHFFVTWQGDCGWVQCANVLLLSVRHNNVKLTFSVETTGPCITDSESTWVHQTR